MKKLLILPLIICGALLGGCVDQPVVVAPAPAPVVYYGDPYYVYGGVNYYYTGGRYFYYRNNHRFYVTVLPGGGVYWHGGGHPHRRYYHGHWY